LTIFKSGIKFSNFNYYWSKGDTDILTVLMLTGVLSEFKHFSSAEIYVGGRFCLYYAEAEGLLSAEKMTICCVWVLLD